jgi:hypothetical protein
MWPGMGCDSMSPGDQPPCLFKFFSEIGELMRKIGIGGDILWIQISNIINMIINTIVILTLFISSLRDHNAKSEEGGRLTLRKKVPLPPLSPPTISLSKIYGPSTISPPLTYHSEWDERAGDVPSKVKATCPWLIQFSTTCRPLCRSMRGEAVTRVARSKGMIVDNMVDEWLERYVGGEWISILRLGYIHRRGIHDPRSSRTCTSPFPHIPPWVSLYIKVEVNYT